MQIRCSNRLMLVDYQSMSNDFLLDVSCAKSGVDLLSTLSQRLRTEGGHELPTCKGISNVICVP